LFHTPVAILYPTRENIALVIQTTNIEDKTMPIVNVKVIEDVFTPEQKTQMITKLTDAMVEIEGENMRGVTWVYIEDIKQGEFGIGGQPLTAADVHKLQKGEAAA
jgi:4-oxalocrotonate tautomerase